MEKEYINELDHAYLVLAGEQIDEDEYVLQMAVRKKLGSILPISVFSLDGKKSLRADVTACTSITSRFRSVALTGDDIRKILSSLRDTAARMPALLMSIRDLYLDPDCVFLGPDGDEVLLCYIPHISDSEPDSVRLLAEFLLKKLDHSDQRAVSLVYPLYDQVSSDSYDLVKILSTLLQPEEKEERKEDGNTAPSHSRLFGPDAGELPSDIPGWNKTPPSNVKKLPPPASKRRAAKRTGARKHGRSTPKGLRHLLPAAVILPAALVFILLFQMDLTQIMGMGFLCASLIWIIHSSLEKQSAERKNLWFDEEEESQSDELFYQSLRDELYAKSDLPGKEAPQAAGSGYAQTAGSIRVQAAGSGYAQAAGSMRTQTARSGYAQAAGSMRAQAAGYGCAQAADSVQEDQTRLLRQQLPALISLQKDLCPDIWLDQDHLILGKNRSRADVVLPGDTVSRKHARIERRMDGYYVTDLFSTNGTFLDGHRLESGRSYLLKDGAQLTIASYSFRAAIPSSDRDTR